MRHRLQCRVVLVEITLCFFDVLSCHAMTDSCHMHTLAQSLRNLFNSSSSTTSHRCCTIISLVVARRVTRHRSSRDNPSFTNCNRLGQKCRKIITASRTNSAAWMPDTLSWGTPSPPARTPSPRSWQSSRPKARPSPCSKCP